MENEMIDKIVQAEREAKDFEEEAKKNKEHTIADAEDIAEKNRLQFEVEKKTLKERLDESTSQKNKAVLEQYLAESQSEINNLKQKVSDNKNSAITLVMSLIS
ncbi:hypothetical protein FL857_08765 [Criibacterium bergeronii]|uniref:ATPase n=1 Tax=Criibacterium bergeronii TaxID=1871336 RepID=A0A552V113_9FIRM|nr:hypothetical protein [Criibacterium bergeronii]TRW24166.1 hypothetical protein FL857_08765 [Criibacterium bergeronii]